MINNNKHTPNGTKLKILSFESMDSSHLTYTSTGFGIEISFRTVSSSCY